MDRTCLLYLFIGFFFLLDLPMLVFICLYKQPGKTDEITLLTNDYIILVFGLMFVAMSILLFQIVQRINRVAGRLLDFAGEGKRALESEKVQLTIVLIVFDISFLIKVCLCATIFPKEYSGEITSPFASRMISIAPAIFMDAVPIFCVLYMHH
jgi:hypothetical protein